MGLEWTTPAVSGRTAVCASDKTEATGRLHDGRPSGFRLCPTIDARPTAAPPREPPSAVYARRTVPVCLTGSNRSWWTRTLAGSGRASRQFLVIHSYYNTCCHCSSADSLLHSHVLNGNAGEPSKPSADGIVALFASSNARATGPYAFSSAIDALSTGRFQHVA